MACPITSGGHNNLIVQLNSAVRMQTKASCLAGATRSIIRSMLVVRVMKCRSAFLDICLSATLATWWRSPRPAHLVH